MSASPGPRTTNAYAAFEPSGALKPWQYESRPLGAEDVEIKVTHCGICGGDIRALDNSSTPFPSVPGHEIVGEVGSIQHMAGALQLAGEKNICPIVETLPMTQINEGIERIRTGKAHYRIIPEN